MKAMCDSSTIPAMARGVEAAAALKSVMFVERPGHGEGDGLGVGSMMPRMVHTIDCARMIV